MRANTLFFLLLAAAHTARPQDIRREYAYATLSDGTRLAYVLSVSREPGRYPALVLYEPYWGGGSALGDEEQDYAAHGYAVIEVNIRGTGCSTGRYAGIMSEQDAADGAEFIEWVGRQPWCDGNVGMFGNSYPGNIQFFVAARQPKYLKALAAGGLVADSYSQVGYPGGIFNAAFIGQWTFFTQPGVSQVGVNLRLREGDRECTANRAGHAPNPTYADMRRHPFRDDFWRERSASSLLDRVAVPTLISQGWQDQQTAVEGAVQIFEGLRVPRKLILTNGRHEVYKAALLRAERIRWFDRWLKGQPNGVENEPRVTVWFEAQGDLPGTRPAWKEHFPGWPVPGAGTAAFHLTADGRLNPAPPTGEKQSGTRRYLYPTVTEMPYTAATFAMPPFPLGSLVYRSAPATEDLVILGAPLLTLHLASENVDTDIMATLHEIDSAGNVTYLQRGFLRASHRAIDAAGSRPHRIRHAHDRVEELAPGQVYELKVPFYSVGHALRSGHSLELVILAPPVNMPGWAFAIQMLPGMNTVYHSVRYPSRLELPVVPGLKARAPAPPCGALELQPCRPARRAE